MKILLFVFAAKILLTLGGKSDSSKNQKCSCNDEGWFRIGTNTCVRTLVELNVSIPFNFFFDGVTITIDDVADYSDPQGNPFLVDGYWTPNIIIGGQLIKNNDKLVLVDTGNALKDSFGISENVYNQLVDIGCEDIDYIIHTHMHSDHTGGNTRYEDETETNIIPTYEQYGTVHLIQYDEFEYWKNVNNVPIYFDELIQPLIDAGIIQLTFNDYAITDNIYVTKCPGHTPGHQCVWVDSQCNHNNIKILFVGDLAHVPIQILNPSWAGVFDYNATLNTQTRTDIIETAFDNNIILSFAHFGYPNYGKIVTCASCNGESGYAYQQLSVNELTRLCNRGRGHP